MNKLRVLLVEDNPADVVMTRSGLKKAAPDCEISVARNGFQALEVLRKCSGEATVEMPHVVLLDINMPGMNGKEFLTAIKADETLKRIPVVMFTSSDAPNDINDCYGRHANSYVVKPFSLVDYTKAMDQIVRFWGELNTLPEGFPRL